MYCIRNKADGGHLTTSNYTLYVALLGMYVNDASGKTSMEPTLLQLHTFCNVGSILTKNKAAQNLKSWYQD